YIRFKFSDVSTESWYFLPIDLTNVIKCEITGKWKRTESFKISSLTFIRPETPEECSIRESKEKTWSDAPIVKPVLKCSGDKLDSYTINSAYEHLSSDSDSLEEFPYADGSAIIDPPFLRFKACADFLSKESRDYDQSSNACAILTRNPTKNILVSRISIHFRPCFLSGAHVCV
ncbi:hypothetical protein ADUPG1_002014, partial [Aduncisulcus paluster]